MVSGETFWYDLGQEPWKAAYIQRLELSAIARQGATRVAMDPGVRLGNCLPRRTSCPRCGSGRRIDIQATLWIRVGDSVLAFERAFGVI